MTAFPLYHISFLSLPISLSSIISISFAFGFILSFLSFQLLTSFSLFFFFLKYHSSLSTFLYSLLLPCSSPTLVLLSLASSPSSSSTSLSLPPLLCSSGSPSKRAIIKGENFQHTYSSELMPKLCEITANYTERPHLEFEKSNQLMPI